MRPRVAVLAAIAGAMSVAGQTLPSLTKMVEQKNWFFEQAVHPETHLIYSRVNLEDPDHWKKTVFPSPDSVRGKSNDDSEAPNLSNCRGGRAFSWPARRRIRCRG